MTWLYNGVILDSIMIPEKAIGFIYKITHLESEKAYIGKKLLYFKKSSLKTLKRKNGEKYKKKTSSQVPSDWETYWGSSERLLKDIEVLGADKFKRFPLLNKF